MMSPDGKFYPCSNHLDWAHDNYTKFGIVFTPDLVGDYKPDPNENEAAIFDQDGRIAFDHFKDAGWIRVKENGGVELDYLSASNIRLVKKIISNMAKSSKGRSLYVDAGEGTLHVPISYTGRPDFSELDTMVSGSVTASWLKSMCKFADHGDTLQGQMMDETRAGIIKEVTDLKVSAGNLNEVLPRWRGEVRREILLLPPPSRIARMSMYEMEVVQQDLNTIKESIDKYNVQRMSEILGNADKH